MSTCQVNAKLRGLVEKILLVSGFVGLSGMDQDFLRWSILFHWVVELYRSFADSTRELLWQWLGISVSPAILDVVYITGVLLAAANAHSFRRYGMFTVVFAMRITFMEQVQMRSSDRIWRSSGPQKEALFIARIAAAVSVAMAIVLLAFIQRRVMSLETGQWWISASGFLYLFGGFYLLAKIDDQVPHDDPELSDNEAYKTLKAAYVIFAPVTVVRFSAFLMYTLLFSVIMAWRWYLVLLLSLLVVAMMNEIYYQFVHDWAGQVPDCAIFSIEPLCPSSRWPAVP